MANITRLIKVGGSLLDLEGLGSALRRWLDQQTPGTNILMAGGGRLADSVRQADEHYSLGDELSHWLSVDLLSVTARMIRAALPGVEFISRFDELREKLKLASSDTAGPIGDFAFDPARFLRDCEPHSPGKALPCDWSVTSDSIAAAAAEALQADELVLLKSANPPLDRTTQGAVLGKYVDDYFPRAAARLSRIRCVNLREPGFPEWTLKQNQAISQSFAQQKSRPEESETGLSCFAHAARRWEIGSVPPEALR